MGNCQEADAAAVVIQHSGDGKVERLYWPATAADVMRLNPGHYVALVVLHVSGSGGGGGDAKSDPAVTAVAGGGGGARIRKVKLLKSKDTLLLGQVNRLPPRLRGCRRDAVASLGSVGRRRERRARPATVRWSFCVWGGGQRGGGAGEEVDEVVSGARACACHPCLLMLAPPRRAWSLASSRSYSSQRRPRWLHVLVLLPKHEDMVLQYRCFSEINGQVFQHGW